METKSKDTARRSFIKNILAIDLALLLVSSIASLISELNIGIILFFLGIIIGAIGVMLGNPLSPSDPPQNPNNRPFDYYRNHPNEQLADEISYETQHLLPRYAFENAIAYAGLIATILSIPFVIQVMFSK